MKSYTTVSAILGVIASGVVFAQGGTPPATPGSQPSDPSAASTPHQRAATKAPAGDEAPAASSGTSPSDAATPHQKDSMKKKHKPKKDAAGDTPPATP